MQLSGERTDGPDIINPAQSKNGKQNKMNAVSRHAADVTDNICKGARMNKGNLPSQGTPHVKKSGNVKGIY